MTEGFSGAVNDKRSKDTSSAGPLVRSKSVFFPDAEVSFKMVRRFRHGVPTAVVGVIPSGFWRPVSG